ncbi:hypothetical protein, partial [uncultured Vagococcus sp.]|uniref:hypothetical protein n=1 Tax=uncultured Vagococcus sp. TaxID=189676 RepID=UPI0028D02BAC
LGLLEREDISFMPSAILKWLNIEVLRFSHFFYYLYLRENIVSFINPIKPPFCKKNLIICDTHVHITSE